MKRKNIPWVLSVMLLCMIVFQPNIASASAFGGLLDTAILTKYDSTDHTSKGTWDQSASVVLSPASSTSADMVEYVFSETATVGSVKLQANSGPSWRMVLYDSANQELLTHTFITSEVTSNSSTPLVTLPETTGVKMVRLYQISGVNVSLYKWDLMGTPTPPADTTPPPVPTGITGTAGNTQVELSWTAVSAPDLAGYFVWMDGVKQNGTAITGTSYTATGLTNGVSYSFQVSSIDATGNESSRSTSLSRTPQPPPDTTPPDAPTNLTGTPGDKSAVLTWTGATAGDKAGYNLYRGGIKQNLAVISGTTYTQTGLSNGSTYTYTVKTVDTSGNESAASNSVEVTPEQPVIALAMSLSGNGESIIVNVTGGTMPYNVNWGGAQTDTFSASVHYIMGVTKSTTYTVTLTDDDGTVVTKTVDTGSFSAPLVPIMPNSTSLFQNMINSFGKAGTIALVVIGGAVALGLIVILALWAWRLTKKWLASSK